MGPVVTYDAPMNLEYFINVAFIGAAFCHLSKKVTVYENYIKQLRNKK